MSVATIKAITKRIRVRYGSTKAAAMEADVSPVAWSGYESADHPETTIPIGRLVGMSLTTAERRAIASLFSGTEEYKAVDLPTEACEANEATSDLQRVVRLAAADGIITEAEKRTIRDAGLTARKEVDDVIQGAS